MLNDSVAATATAQCDMSLAARKTLPPLTNLYRSRPVRPRRSTRVFLHFACAPDYSSLTQLMREMSLKIVNNGGIVRSIQNHGIRQLPHRFKAKYVDQEGNRYYEKGRFISVFYDASPKAMREVEAILRNNEEILRNTHLKATNKFSDVNNLNENKNPYVSV